MLAMNNSPRVSNEERHKETCLSRARFPECTINEGIRSTHDAVSQLQLKFTYQALAASGLALPGLKEVGFKAFSQTDEDGILLYIFSII